MRCWFDDEVAFPRVPRWPGDVVQPGTLEWRMREHFLQMSKEEYREFLLQFAKACGVEEKAG